MATLSPRPPVLQAVIALRSPSPFILQAGIVTLSSRPPVLQALIAHRSPKVLVSSRPGLLL